MAAVGLRRPARPRARCHLRPGPSRLARRAGGLDRHRACSAGRPGLRRRGRPANLPDQEADQAEHDRRPERGNSLLKTTFKALRRISLCPWRIGPITAAALVLLHTEHNRTTRSTHYWERLTDEQWAEVADFFDTPQR